MHRLAFVFLTMVIVWSAGVVSIAIIDLVWSICVTQGVLPRWPGFLLRDCRWLFLGSSKS